MSNVETRPLFSFSNYFFLKLFWGEECEEDLRLEERLILDGEEELFELRDEYLFDVEILVPRDEFDREKEERYREDEYDFFEVERLTIELASGALNLVELVVLFLKEGKLDGKEREDCPLRR